MKKVQKPIIYNSKEELPKNIEIIETIDGSLKELFFIRNPKFKKEMPEAQEPLKEFLEDSRNIKTVWVFYPWLNKAVHLVNEEVFFELRTARNRNLITKEEQEKYRNIKVGITGLSIGSNILWPLVMSGGPRFLKITDPDIIEASNLNRLNAPITLIGENKSIYASKKVWEIDPFAQLECWTEGVSKDNLKKFMLDKPRLDIFIDEIDDLELKILSRYIAKENKIPVIMITNVGDRVILDVERFDVEPNHPILHGRLGEVKPEDFKSISYQEWVKLATKIVGEENLSDRLKSSTAEIGKTVAAVPQIATTATISGAVAAYAIREIATSKKMKSGRYIFDIEEKLN